MSKKLTAIALVICCLLLPGCQGAKKVDSQAFCMSIGFDKGTERKYGITFQIPSLDEKNMFEAIYAEGDSVAECLSNANSVIPFSINAAQSNFIVFSEELAADMGITREMRDCMSLLKVDTSGTLIISEGKAKDFLEGFKSENNLVLTRVQENIIEASERSATFPKVRIVDFYSEYLDGLAQPICALGISNDKQGDEKEQQDTETQEREEAPKNENVAGTYQSENRINQPVQTTAAQKTQQFVVRYYDDCKVDAGEMPASDGLMKSTLRGSGIFNREGKLIAALDGALSKYLMMMRGDLKQTYLVLPDPEDGEKMLSFLLIQDKQPHIVVKTGETPVKVTVTVHLTGRVINAEEKPKRMSQDKISKIETYLNAYLTEHLRMIADISKKLNCDFTGIGKTAVKQFLTTGQWKEFDWESKFSEAQIETRAEFLMDKAYITGEQE